MPYPIHYKGRDQYNQREDKPAEPKSGDTRRVMALRQTVIENLGRPDDLSLIDIKPLWNNNFYRVNVYRELAKGRTLTDSFFVQIVDDGVLSDPPMKRKYLADRLEAVYPTSA